MKTIIPNFWFDKNAEEAVNFYTSLFANSKIDSTSRFGKEGFEHHGMPEGTIMTMSFELEGQKFVALNGGPIFKFNEAISFYVYCESASEVERLYKVLSENGSINMPLDKYDWSEKYAWIKDKYGVSWQVVPNLLYKLISDKDRAKSSRAMNAMLKMKKNDIKTLKKAFEGN